MTAAISGVVTSVRASTLAFLAAVPVTARSPKARAGCRSGQLN